MEYLKINEPELISKGAIDTAKEIAEQPLVWKNTYDKFFNERNSLAEFWSKVVEGCDKIILTGAGTSAYIGYSLEGPFQRHTGVTTVSVATTHIVTHPHDYLQEDVPTLLVSFARSGNSPESVAAAELADSICKVCYHLVITCDEEGQLAKFESKNSKYNFILPAESNDKSLAMTSSYTSMLLSGLLFARINEIDALKNQVDAVINYGKNIIDNYSDKINQISTLDFNRAVFLGSGPLYGTATESQLKLQELTDGQVICKNDTFLGFRHGPKAVVYEKTVVVFIFSNNEYSLKYEKDLVKAMQKEAKYMTTVGISESAIEGISLDTNIYLSEAKSNIEEDFLAVCSVLPGQILGFYKSLNMGLKPDAPSVSGTIARVVEGVVIYDDFIK